MKIIKNKYIKILFALVCLFGMNDKIFAATVCRYEIEDDAIPYDTLTVGFSEGTEDAVNPYRQENGEYVAEYVLWYQFDDGPQHALKKENLNSTNSQLWNLDTRKTSYRNFINANNWIARKCNIKQIDILYNSSKTVFGFSLSATDSQKQFDNLQNVVTVKLAVQKTDEKVGFIDTLQESVNCGGLDIPYGIPYIVNRIIVIIKIFTPIILIILGMVDFVRAVISSDEKQMKEASSRFIRRILAGVIIFFVVAVVQFAFRLVGTDGDGSLGCFNCFVNGDCGK